MFVGVALYAQQVPNDVSIVSGFLALIILLYLLFRRAKKSIVTQAINYVAGAFVIYLATRYSGEHSPLAHDIEIIYFVILAVSIALAIRATKDTVFKVTPTDYLVVFVVLFVGALLHEVPAQVDITEMIAKFVLVFYSCELIISRMKSEWNILNFSTLASLSILAIRGVL
jgi:UDP-GlcNAc:undecaprenyl-phosphate GlcNAc-1-phosphate transferase